MKKNNDECKYISRRELSERWSLSIETLKRREREGKLPFTKLETQVRYKLATIEKIERDGEVGGR